MTFKKIVAAAALGAFAFAGPTAIASASDGDREVKKQVAPDYPRGAERRGIEGHVLVEFNILAGGEVADIRVVESQPEGVFDDAVVNAVSKWKYETGANDTVKQAKLSFKK